VVFRPQFKPGDDPEVVKYDKVVAVEWALHLNLSKGDILDIEFCVQEKHFATGQGGYDVRADIWNASGDVTFERTYFPRWKRYLLNGKPRMPSLLHPQSH